MSKPETLSLEMIKLSPDNTQLLLTIQPVESVVSAQIIICLLQHPSFPRFKLNKEGIKAAISAFSIIAEDDSECEFDPIAIADKHDAQLNIVVSADKMNACAEITSTYGGSAITLSDIKEKCDKIGIKFGLLTKPILALINTCNKAPPGKTYKANIATGQPSIDGVNAYFEKSVSTDNHRKPAPRLLPNGNVDMHDLGKTITVHAGAVLMKKILATEGSSGKTVTGEIITQKLGKDREFIVGGNVEVDPNNPLHLMAKQNGIPIDDGKFIRVDEIMLVNNIDVKNGNVEYDGSVIVTGDIHEGMRIKTTGDITVMGLIESAEIICGGDLTVKKPIIGHQKQTDNNFSCKIDCQGNLTGTIAQYCHLNVGKNIIMSNQLIHCETECKGSITVFNDTFKKGSIIGGITCAYGNIVTAVVGTPAGNKTIINLEGNFQRLIKDKKKYTHNLQVIDKIIKNFKKAEERAQALLDLEKRKNTQKQLAEEKQQYRIECDHLQQLLSHTKIKIDHYYKTTHLTVSKILHSDTTVRIGLQNWGCHHELGPSVISVKNEKIQLTPYQKS